MSDPRLVRMRASFPESARVKRDTVEVSRARIAVILVFFELVDAELSSEIAVA